MQLIKLSLLIVRAYSLWGPCVEEEGGVEGAKSCFRVVSYLDGNGPINKLCSPPKTCSICLDFVNRGGECVCGFSCYDYKKHTALNSSKKQAKCNKGTNNLMITLVK
ncbi:hypothetical protein CONCODRAFT_11919 [Conidiobolus coronatus NRRL 28638]|uniref:Extracellular membrane protein CFEM domain-containing protein n=1 Tax=Conidiobolus coronatus (strain ATCC 28846 / CBS 209.66 / NRRL 28638) TaxID=796925 RepID=A0A137NUC3_CONC2|nr:hypothetical protein CONCODRAFT_11919 [Conidiobolus coronatus NRRL 28638]|eukprot:KXN66271.1 hypothetical protein CONCODRAFT_11919 [Conidiobolus coronatus NRRL 28638]